MKDDADRAVATHQQLEAELAVAEMVGRLMHFWGFKRPMGRAWTVLYLSPRPLSAAELAERLSMSAGGISMTLGALEKWGCIERIWVPGERREYFRAEPDIWKMVQRVLAQREAGLVREFGQAIERAQLSMQAAAGRSADSDSGAETFKLERLTRLAQLTSAGETLLSALVAGHAVDPTFLVHPSARPDADGTARVRRKPVS